MENYQFDENFINQGWSEMKPILDKEMPEKKKTRFGFFWISAVSGIAATVLVSWFALSDSSFWLKNDHKKNSIVSENKENKIEKDIAKVASNNDAFLNKNTTNLDQNTKSKIYTKAKNKEISNIFLQEKNTQNRDYQNITLSKNENTIILNEKTNSIATQNNSNTIIAKRENIAIALIENDKKFGAVNSQKNDKQLDLAYLKTTVKTKRNYQIGIFAGVDRTFTNINVGNEFLGLKYAKRSKKNLFELSLFYQNTKKFSPIYYQERLFIDPKQTGLATGTVVQDVIYPWNCNCNGNYPLVSDEIKTYSSVLLAETTRQIGIGIGYGYRLNKRWELNGNLGMTINISAPSYQIEDWSASSGKNYSNLTSEINTLNFPNSKNAVLYDALINNLYNIQIKNGNTDLSIFKKYDISGSIGASYYLYKNFKISLLRKQGFINLTPNNILNRTQTSNGWQMQMTKYF